MSTQKQYYYDSYIREFEATIIEVLPYENRYAIILDKTHFYPESGGQPSDSGTINGLAISYVTEKNDMIYHIADTKPSLGAAHCSIDWRQRFDHMQQHSGQHILSACFYSLFHGETSSFHIGKESATIEIDLAAFDAEMAEKIEKAANDYIYRNLPVTAQIVGKDALSSFPLRKQPQVESDIRIITIEDCDCTPCGGTHVRNTGEIGIIKLRRWEKLKSSYKFDFVCGQRALTDYTVKNQLVNKLGAYLSAPDSEVENAFAKLTDNFKELQKQISQLRSEIVSFEVQELLGSAQLSGSIQIASKVYENRDFNDIKLIAQGITVYPSCVALLGSSQSGQLIFSRSDDLDLNMNNILKAILPGMNGKGGGSPKTAQGGGTGDIKTAIDTAVGLING